MTEMTVSETLNRAADLIEQYGWRQNGWGLAYNGAPVLPICAEGAIVAASGQGERWSDAFHGHIPNLAAEQVVDACPASKAVKQYLDYLDIADWNDAPGRTSSEVIEVLRACAVIEASRERQPAQVSS